MPSFYSMDVENVPSHVPEHPERTVYGGNNPFNVYYHVFHSRTAMQQWMHHQSWEERQHWRPWISVRENRKLLALRSAANRKNLLERAAARYQPSLF